MFSKIASSLTILIAAAVVSGHAAETKAIAEVQSVSGSRVAGMVMFKDTADGVRVVAIVKGLEPGKHGFHVHEYGECTDSGASAGGHFNPTGTSHGGPMSMHHHAGDMGNIVADSTGTAHVDQFFPGLSLQGPASILGRSVVVHAKIDDMTSQPSGNSGTRIGCGVIGLAKP
ncbi:MAG TPA: superoxide dismutase family protein [Fibrobacteria bacterium]|nr:superoxide dismutase family protein [Fibrobacteria bacterium]